MADIAFNPLEVFVLAEQIERNGAAFYRRAAEGSDSSRIRRLLLELAGWEEDHQRVFAGIREKLERGQQGEWFFDSEKQAVQYLEAMTGGYALNLGQEPGASLTGEETIEDVVRIAIGLEKDSIVFYVGIQQALPEGVGGGKVDRILKEEMRHISLLSNELKALKGKVEG
jgi:rubrerythrin